MTTIPAEPPSTLVEFKGVTKRYGRGGRVVLDDFSHRFVRGETHFICGRSGAGKSTLIRCINGLEDIESGIIEIEGEELHHRSVRAVRRRVAMVFQDFNLFPHLSVAKNLCVGPMHTLGRSKADALETAHRYLTVVGMSEYADVRPNSLSGGQKQRVAIARALCMGPDLILFDEPTSALDPESVGGVLEVMKSLAAEGRSMIVVSHEMGFARDAADLISFLEDGKFVQTSPPDEFFGAPATPSVARFLEQIRK